MKKSPLSSVTGLFVLLCVCSSLLPQALLPQALAQDFTSIGSDLDQLENLISDTISNIEDHRMGD